MIFELLAKLHYYYSIINTHDNYLFEFKLI